MGIHEKRRADELDDGEEHREDRAEDDRAVEVRPDDEQWEHEQRPPADAAPGGVDEQPEHAREERQRCCLGAQRPAPRAGEDRQQADDERRAGRRPARPRGRRRQAQGQEDERDPEEDDGAHPGELVGAVEDDLGEPLLVRPRGALAEDGDRLGLRQAVVDDLASRHQRQPGVAHDERGGEDGEQDDSDETRRAGSGRGSSRGSCGCGPVSPRARGAGASLGSVPCGDRPRAVVGLSLTWVMCAPGRGVATPGPVPSDAFAW